ncbi:MAG: hypothetical protein ABWZ01_07205 [Methyloceanibacter sp.]
MATTQRIEELLARAGSWTPAEIAEAKEIAMGRDAGYMPEGTEDWMDGEPRAYDKPRRELSLTPPPPRPAEFKELAKAGLHEPGPREKPSGEDDRIKTIEATLTDLVRRLKALEERIIDPSA